MAECVCSPAPAPFDHLQQVDRKCIAHNWDVILVKAGWKREGAIWTHHWKIGLWTKEQAIQTLEEKTNDED